MIKPSKYSTLKNTFIVWFINCKIKQDIVFLTVNNIMLRCLFACLFKQK